MKKMLFIIIACSMLAASGCNTYKKNLYLPQSDRDEIFTTVGTEQNTSTPKALAHDSDGYYISVPDTYRYEKDYDDGAIEESWEKKSSDDVSVKVTTYKNSDEITARGLFLREHDDYVFEDLLGYPLCGMEKDGDTLWFNLYEGNGNVYIVSFEYDKNTKEKVITELSDIAETFKLKGSAQEKGEAHEQICGYPTAEQQNK